MCGVRGFAQEAQHAKMRGILHAACSFFFAFGLVRRGARAFFVGRRIAAIFNVGRTFAWGVLWGSCCCRVCYSRFLGKHHSRSRQRQLSLLHFLLPAARACRGGGRNGMWKSMSVWVKISVGCCLEQEPGSGLGVCLGVGVGGGRSGFAGGVEGSWGGNGRGGVTNIHSRERSAEETETYTKGHFCFVFFPQPQTPTLSPIPLQSPLSLAHPHAYFAVAAHRSRSSDIAKSMPQTFRDAPCATSMGLSPYLFFAWTSAPCDTSIPRIAS